MEVTLNKAENELDATLNILITPDDYQPEIKKALNKIQKKVAIPGFRIGMAPMGMVNRYYAKQVKMEEVEKAMQKGLNSYLDENKVEYLLSPVSTFNYEEIQWNGENFEFGFQLGLKPPFQLNFEPLNELSKPMVNILEEDVEEEIKNLQKRFAERDFLDIWDGNPEHSVSIRLTEVDAEGTVVEGGKSGYKFYQGQEVPETLSGLLKSTTKGTAVPVNIKDLFSAAETASILRIKEEEVADLQSSFTLTVDSVIAEKLPEMNAEFFTKIGLEEGASAEDLKEKQKEEITKYMELNADNYFQRKIRDYLVENSGINLPEEFLNQYFEQAHDKTKIKNEEEKVKSLNLFKKDMIWMLIADEILEVNGLEVTETDIQSVAFESVYRLFMQVGYNQATYDMIANYTQEWLKNENNRSEAMFKAKSNVVYEFLNGIVNPKEEIMTIKEFNNLV